MRRLIFTILAFALVLATILLVTYMGAPPVQQSTFRIRPDGDTILFQVTPWEESRETREGYRPLLEFLSDRTGRKFQLLIVEDYDAAIDNMAEGTIDMAILPPVSFVTAKRRSPGLKYVSTIIREKEGHSFTTYMGYLMARKTKFAGWTFDDFLKDPNRYRIGLVAKRSSSGWAYPMAMMKKRGLDPDQVFGEVRIFDNHPDVTDAVALGEIDLGATWEYNLEQARKKHGDIFSIVWTSPPIPGLAWVAAEKISDSFVKEIRKIQDEITSSPGLKARLLQTTPDKGWEVVDEQFYDGVREVVEYVGAFD